MLEKQINTDYIAAMKARKKDVSTTLNFLRAQLKNKIIELKADSLEDKDVVAIIKKQIKQRQDSIEMYKKGGREELASKEQGEMDLLKGYLPEEMAEAEVQKLVEEAIQESKASSMKDMGLVMKALLPKVDGKADNKLVSQLVKKNLSSL